MRIHKRRGTILISIDVSLKNPALAGICTLKQWTELKSTLTSSGFFLFCFLVIIHEHLYLKAFSRCPITHSDLQFFSPPNMKSFYLSLQCFSATKPELVDFEMLVHTSHYLQTMTKWLFHKYRLFHSCAEVLRADGESFDKLLCSLFIHTLGHLPPHLSNNYSSEDWRWSCSVRSLYHAHKYHCVKASWHIWAHFHNWRPPSRQVYWIIGRCLHTLTQAGTHLPAL